MSRETKILVLGDFFSSTPNEILVHQSFYSLLESNDLKCCTFEGPIFSHGKKTIKSGPSIAQSVDSPALLEKCGLNIISLAN